jgi:hypothetical protein
MSPSRIAASIRSGSLSIGFCRILPTIAISAVSMRELVPLILPHREKPLIARTGLHSLES